MPLKGEVGDCVLNDHGNNIAYHGKIMEKSWNFVFEFLWEPCHFFLLSYLIKFISWVYKYVGKIQYIGISYEVYESCPLNTGLGQPAYHHYLFICKSMKHRLYDQFA